MNHQKHTAFLSSLGQSAHPFTQAVLRELETGFNVSLTEKKGAVIAGEAVCEAILGLLEIGESELQTLEQYWLNNEGEYGAEFTDALPTIKVDMNSESVELNQASPAKMVMSVDPERYVDIYNVSDAPNPDTLESEICSACLFFSRPIKDRFDDQIQHILTPIDYNEDSLNTVGAYIAEQLDINALQVALIPETQTLVATEAFKAFIETLTVKVMAYNTPSKAAIRLMELITSRPYLNVDLDVELRKLQSYRQLMLEAEEMQRCIPFTNRWAMDEDTLTPQERERFDNNPHLNEFFTPVLYTPSQEVEYTGIDSQGVTITATVTEQELLYRLEPTSYVATIVENGRQVIGHIKTQTLGAMISSYFPVVEQLTAEPSIKPMYSAFESLVLEAKTDFGEVAFKQYFDAFERSMATIRYTTPEEVSSLIGAAKRLIKVMDNAAQESRTFDLPHLLSMMISTISTHGQMTTLPEVIEIANNKGMATWEALDEYWSTATFMLPESADDIPKWAEKHADGIKNTMP